MKVLLVNPPMGFSYYSLGIRRPPLGLAYLASVLRDHHQVKMKRLNPFSDSLLYARKYFVGIRV